MSAQLPPNPILTTYQYWNWVNVDEATRRQRALDNSYMTFPTVQNYPVSFSKLFIDLITQINHMANTSYVYDKINDLLFMTTNNWTGLNTFGSIDTGAITTNAITATTLALVNTQLDTPLSSSITYSNIPFTLANGTTSYGTAGQIGYTIVRANSGGYIGGTPSGDTYWREINNISLTAGVWLLTGETQSGGSNGAQTGIGFNTTTNTNVGGIGFRGVLRSQFSVPAAGNPYGQVSTTAIYYASGTVTMRLMMGCSGFGLAPGKNYLTAIRIA